MKELIINDIIAISGEPVSGKGTAVNALVEEWKKSGYNPEDIIVISTGEEYRKYFNTIMDFIKNFEDIERLTPIIEKEELKQIYSKNEYRSILLETIKELKSNEVDLSNFSIEKANTMKELTKIRKVIDTLIDGRIKSIGEELELQNQETKKVIQEYKKAGKDIESLKIKRKKYIFDSRLASYNINSAFSIRLTTNADVAAERLFNDKKRGREDSKYETIEDAKIARENRKIGEIERFMQRYNIDLSNPENYDLIIDTSYSTIKDITDVIFKCFECYQKEESFVKNWTSPKTLLPNQDERETMGRQLNTFEEVLESIKTKGYLPCVSIEIVEVDGHKYIVDGHHRNFAAAYLGKTLVPYVNSAKDDEYLPKTHFTARQLAKGTTYRMLKGHEWLIKEDFSYNDIYPGIYEKLIKELEER